MAFNNVDTILQNNRVEDLINSRATDNLVFPFENCIFKNIEG